MPVRRPRLSLLGQFSLLSLVLIVGARARCSPPCSRARSSGARCATPSSSRGSPRRSGSRRGSSPATFGEPLSPLRLSQLDTELRQSGLETVGLERVKIFNSRGDLVYSDDRSLIGRNEIGSEDVREALAGGVVSEIEHGIDDDGRGRQVLEVYTPLPLGSGAGVDGALEIYLSYDAVAAAISATSARSTCSSASASRCSTRCCSGSSPARRGGCATSPCTTPSPACRTARSSTSASSGDQGMRPEPHGRGAAHRPRPLQGGQRHARARPRRRAAARSWPSASAARCATGDTLARLGGDEFAVVLADLPHRGAAAEIAGAPARRAAPAVRPARDRGRARRERRRRAVARARPRRHDAAPARRRRDVRRQAHPGPRRDLLDRARPLLAGPARLLGELRRAIENDELVLHYQPKVSLDATASRRRGARALAAPRARAAAARRSSSRSPSAPARSRTSRAGCSTPRCASAPSGAREYAGADRRGQPRRRQRARRRPAEDGRGAARRARPARRARSSARSPSTRVMSDPQRVAEVLGGAARARRPALARRLRHRPGLARLPEGAAARRGQDRPLVRHRRWPTTTATP